MIERQLLKVWRSGLDTNFEVWTSRYTSSVKFDFTRHTLRPEKEVIDEDGVIKSRVVYYSGKLGKRVECLILSWN